jgi:ferric-dicitrate binding protein FerR (iron transport regulator)
MTAPDLEDLFEKHLSGRLRPEEKRLLADRLEADPAVQREFVEHLQWSAMLARGLAQREKEKTGTGGPASTRRLRAVRRARALQSGFWLAAAAGLLVALAAYRYLNAPPAPAGTPREASPVAQVQPLPATPAPEPAPAEPPPPAPPAVTLAVLEEAPRDARLVRGPDTRPLAGGEALVEGDRIETGADGEAAFRYADDATRLRVGPRTALAMRRPDGAKQVRLEAGELSASVAKQPDGRPMTFATPHAEATVLGTRLTLSVDRESSRLDVAEGTVRYARAPAQAVVVGAGEYAIASDWEALRVRKVQAAGGGVFGRLVPERGCLWGVSLRHPPTAAEARGAMAALESKVGRKMALAHEYLSFPDAAGDKPFPGEAGKAWADGGRLLMMSWKPRAGGATLTWSDVAAGRHDAAYVDPAARKLAAWGRRCFLTLHHQPDDDIGPAGSGMTPADFVAMWRHVRARFDAAGASNVVWVWNVISGTTDASTWDALYPGDGHVDWLSCSSYNFQPGPWRSVTESTRAFREWAGRTFTGARAKPVMLCVIACAENPGDPAAKEAWLRALPAAVAAMPAVKGVVYWSSDTNATTYAVESSPGSLAGYRAAGLDPVFNPE